MDKKDLAKMLKQRRVAIPLTLHELSARTGVSPSHLGRIERGERFPSARVVRKIAGPLGFSEFELFTLAELLPPQPEVERVRLLDAYVAGVLSQEPVEVQRSLVAILSIMKSIGSGNIGFAEYIHRNYPEVDEDTVTMVGDILQHPHVKR